MKNDKQKQLFKKMRAEANGLIEKCKTEIKIWKIIRFGMEAKTKTLPNG